VGNAGITRIGRVADLDVQGWSAMVDVNVKGILHGIAAALPVFRRQGSGHLVTVVSTSGLKIVPTQAVYAGTKNAVRTLLEGLLSFAFPVQVCLLDEFLARFPGTARKHWYLSDGGHFENLGGYELIRRRRPLIVIVDAEQDADFEFGATVWLAADQTTHGSNIVQTGRFGTEGGQWKLQVDTVGGQPSCVIRGVASGATPVVIRSEVSISDSSWHHVVCRREANTVIRLTQIRFSHSARWIASSMVRTS